MRHVDGAWHLIHTEGLIWSFLPVDNGLFTLNGIFPLHGNRTGTNTGTKWKV